MKWNSPAGAAHRRKVARKVDAGKQKAAEDLLQWQLESVAIGGWTREMVFHPTRRWRFDFAWPDELLAVEINGGTFRKGGGAHTGAGFKRDVEKYMAAIEIGWTVMVVMPETVRPGRVLQVIERRLVMARNVRRNYDNTYDAGHLKGYQEGREDAMREISYDRELTR